VPEDVRDLEARLGREGGFAAGWQGRPAASIAGGYVEPTPVVELERGEVTHYLERVGQRLSGRGLTVVWKQPDSPTSKSTVAHAEASSADLIGLTTHGRGGSGRAVFGSVANEIRRRALYPVSLVRVTQREQS